MIEITVKDMTAVLLHLSKIEIGSTRRKNMKNGIKDRDLGPDPTKSIVTAIRTITTIVPRKTKNTNPEPMNPERKQVIVEEALLKKKGTKIKTGKIRGGMDIKENRIKDIRGE